MLVRCGKEAQHAGLVGDRTERSSRPAYGRLCGETEGHNHISPANAESKDHQRMGTLEEAGGNTPSVDSFTGRKTSTPPSAATPPTVGASTTLPLPQSTGEDKGEKGCTPRLVEVRGTDESGGMGDPPRYATSTAVEQPSRTAQEIAARREHQRLQQAEWERAADEKIQNQRILINAQFHQHQHAPEAAHHIRMQQNGETTALFPVPTRPQMRRERQRQRQRAERQRQIPSRVRRLPVSGIPPGRELPDRAHLACGANCPTQGGSACGANYLHQATKGVLAFVFVCRKTRPYSAFAPPLPLMTEVLSP